MMRQAIAAPLLSTFPTDNTHAAYRCAPLCNRLNPSFARQAALMDWNLP
jgi:hypothetical protein